MASLEKRGESYRIVFRYAGKKFGQSLRTKNEKEANASLVRLEDNLRRVELGLLEIPDNADLVLFLLSDGRTVAKPHVLPNRCTLGKLLDDYMASIPAGSLESSTVTGMKIHVKHLKRVLGVKTSIQEFQLADLQQYVESRSQAKGVRGKPLSPATIKKEVVTLNAAWNWAQETGLVSTALPKKGLRYPKTAEKPPFQTWAEIERKIERGGLSEAEQADLWDCLFLTLPEIDELLKHVKEHARHPFIYPMFAFAAHTGARRSEMLRSQIDDVDLESSEVVIHEKKRVRGKLTTRKVPLSPTLCDILRRWFALHPGGNHTFCHQLDVARSSKHREDFQPLTSDESVDHFRRTLNGSKWEKLRGWHVFRHSFCSNCAAHKVDQRVINAWVGHQTEEMVRRYRHLIPNQQQEAIRQVFS